MTKLINKHLGQKDRHDGKETALALTALMIGGVAIGRALNDPAVVEERLESCHCAAKGLVGE